MSTKYMTVGIDIPAYFFAEIEEHEDPVIKAHEIADKYEFEPQWEDASGLRIISLTDSLTGEVLREDQPLEKVYYDAGQLLETALNAQTKEAFINVLASGAPLLLKRPEEIKAKLEALL